jgi:hypothetical protein
VEATSPLPEILVLETTLGLEGRPHLDVAFVAVCDAVLMALEGEGRSPLPRSLSDSASARLTQNLAGSQRGREGLAVSCPIEFRANLRRRAKPGVDLLSAIRIRLLNRARSDESSLHLGNIFARRVVCWVSEIRDVF